MKSENNCDGQVLLNWFQYDQILLELHKEFWYWEAFQYLFIQITSIFVMIKLRKIMTNRNFTTLNLLCLFQFIRLVYQTIFYYKTNWGTDKIPMCESNEISSFMKVFEFKIVNDFIDFFFVLAFYYMVIKMVVFWDFIFFEKIETIQNQSHLFEEEEQLEI